MEILRSEQFEHEGNDCMIYDNVFIYEFHGRYTVVWDRLMIGWFGTSESGTKESYNYLEEALTKFNEKIDFVTPWQHISIIL